MSFDLIRSAPLVIKPGPGKVLASFRDLNLLRLIKGKSGSDDKFEIFFIVNAPNIF